MSTHATQLLRTAAALAALAAAAAVKAGVAASELPQRLADTGLYADATLQRVREGVQAFEPQYPLWSDGADKRRWIALPRGRSIDASRADAWQFPPGTRLWKEFSHAGRRIETRYLERLRDGRWRFATYVWNEQGSDARLAPAEGLRGLARAEAPKGRYDVPSRTDCLACHEGAPVPVLGFTALQLSAARDPLAPHAAPAHAPGADLASLVARGWLRGLDAALLAQPPVIPAADPVERAALGYLHANCAHCHNHNGTPVPVRLTLSQTAAGAAASLERVRQSAVAAPARVRLRDSEAAPSAEPAPRIVAPGQPSHSVLVQRMRSRVPSRQMPPLGTQLTDAEGLALVERWITHLPPQETSP